MPEHKIITGLREAIQYAKITRLLAEDLERARKLSIDELKAAWDRYDGADQPGDPSGESIHRALNERGHGAYCAV